MITAKEIAHDLCEIIEKRYTFGGKAKAVSIRDAGRVDEQIKTLEETSKTKEEAIDKWLFNFEDDVKVMFEEDVPKEEFTKFMEEKIKELWGLNDGNK